MTHGPGAGAAPARPLDAWPSLALVIFDADDTLRTTLVPGQPCPRAPGEWALLPGVADALGRVPWGAPGAPAFALASNQDQVAYGHLTLETSRRLLADCARAATSGHVPPPELLQLCPHALDVPCDCRKPAPGMLRAAMRHAGATPNATLFVGNAESDREAARRAGVRFAWAWDVFGWAGPIAAPWLMVAAPTAPTPPHRPAPAACHPERSEGSGVRTVGLADARPSRPGPPRRVDPSLRSG